MFINEKNRSGERKTLLLSGCLARVQHNFLHRPCSFLVNSLSDVYRTLLGFTESTLEHLRWSCILVTTLILSGPAAVASLTRTDAPLDSQSAVFF